MSVHDQSCITLCDSMDVADQAPLSMGFPRQEYWSGCHFLFQGIRPGSPASPALADGFTSTLQNVPAAAT